MLHLAPPRSTSLHLAPLSLLLILLFFSATRLVSQTTPVQLLKEVAVQNAAFSTSESKIWNNFYQGTTPSHIRLVEVADIHTLITKNELSIIVPGTTDTLLARGM